MTTMQLTRIRISRIPLSGTCHGSILRLDRSSRGPPEDRGAKTSRVLWPSTLAEYSGPKTVPSERAFGLNAGAGDGVARVPAALKS